MVGTWRKLPISRGVPFSKMEGKKWWATVLGKILIYTSTPPKGEEGDPNFEPGNDVTIYIPFYRSEVENYFKLTLTDYTHEELLHFRKIFSEALREAAVVTTLRDADARKKFDAGEVAPARAYRTVSKLFTSEG